MTCGHHPQHPERTIVALFHSLPNTEDNSEMERYGFVVAVADIKRSELITLYRDTRETDAGTRIYSSSLHLDTARYNVTPKVRAFGVRMDIG